MAGLKPFSRGYTTVNGEIVEPFEFGEDSHVKASQRHTQRPAWFCTVSVGLGLALGSLCINLSFLIWIYSAFSVKDGIAIVYQGSCSKTKSLMLTSHLLINVLCTLLLAASNNCSQLLVSPTRDEVDKAHSRGRWLHIGWASTRNTAWISWWRTGLWAILLLSSLPLHLVYNSVFFSTSSASDYFAAAVTEGFTSGDSFNSSTEQLLVNPGNWASINYTEILLGLQKNTKSLQNVDTQACLKAYRRSIVEAPFRSVLMVTDHAHESSWLAGFLNTFETDGASTNLTVGILEDQDHNTYGSETPKSISSWLDGQMIFNDQTCFVNQSGTVFYPNTVWSESQTVSNSNTQACATLPFGDASSGQMVLSTTSWSNTSKFTTTSSTIKYCLAQSNENAETGCTVQASTRLLVVVVICNAMKAACLLATLLSWKKEALAVVGDAITSFLDRPDPMTKGLGTLVSRSILVTWPWEHDRGDFLRQYVTSPKENRKWSGIRHHWGHTICTWTDFVILLACPIAWFMLLIFTSKLWDKADLGEAFANQNVEAGKSFAEVQSRTLGDSLVSNVLLVNTPQLAMSFIYVFLNNAITRMLATNEHSHFAEHPKALRVSGPAGQQRSTYWLQLPYRWSVPLLTIMAFIHWLLSRGIFLLNVRVYDIEGVEDVSRAKYTWAVSSLALLLAVILGICLNLTVFYLTRRRLGSGMPIISTCSLSISAACHPPIGDEDAAYKELRYGVLPQTLTYPDGETVKLPGGHATLSSWTLEPLVIGTEYDEVGDMPPGADSYR